MTVIRDAEYQCSRKTVFYDRKTAKKRMRANQQRHGGKWVVYRCPHCGFWHVGHEMKARNREQEIENTDSNPGGDRTRDEGDS